MDDLNSGDAADALDAATQLVGKLIDQANLHQMGSGHQQATEQTDTAKTQAQDLANMLAGSGATLDIKFEVNQVTLDQTAQTAATA